jgi:site-specific recombinase XerD
MPCDKEDRCVGHGPARPEGVSLSQANQAGEADESLEAIIPIWEASLRARNRSPKTIQSYGDTARLLVDYLGSRGHPTHVANVRREHIELFIADQLARWRPATAALRYRSLKPLFTWLVE